MLPSSNDIATAVRILQQLSLFSVGHHKYGTVISQSLMGAPLMESYLFQLQYKPAVYCEGRTIFVFSCLNTGKSTKLQEA